MKTFLSLIFILLSSINLYSQRLCELGNYDLITNTIIGIEKVPFTMIKFIDNDKPQSEKIRYVYCYDDFGRLVNIDFKGNGNIYGAEDIETGCYKIENATYKYSDSLFPKNIEVKDTQYEYLIKLEYNNLNKIKSITNTDKKGKVLSSFNFDYDNKNQLKLIDKDYNYYYEWDEKSRIKKITIPDPFYIIREYNFKYINNKLSTITKISRFKESPDKIRTQSTYTYIYKNNKLHKVQYGNSTTTELSYSLYNYNNDDKVIITYYTNKDQYEYHYECYY
ncbi:hypothetical protein JAO71_13220 [Olleya sp. YSTF-M6]|uniref:YD repeat-containing protein n=1 Tax=Olleya sediminilitoris TaxID=2795739 RepID=A0ABS1WNR4_9FLAO|nr:hypothetical protein [Olleya sediminilitoris]MBL7560763.1 hypothetical protein [Olleya sediminilitoris]